MKCFYCLNESGYSTTLMVGHTDREGEEDKFFEHLQKADIMAGILFGPTKFTCFRMHEDTREEVPIESLHGYKGDPHKWLSMLAIEGWSTVVSKNEALGKILLTYVIGRLNTVSEPQLSTREAFLG